MQPSTGDIYEIRDEKHRKQLEEKLGEALVPIPEDQFKAVDGMNRHERRKWAKREQTRLREEARRLERQARGK